MKEFDKPSLGALPPPPWFSLSQTVWVREIWVHGRLLCLGLISSICSFFMVCGFFVFLFGFLLCLLVCSSSLCFCLGFFFVVLFDLFMEVESLKLEFHPRNPSSLYSI